MFSPKTFVVCVLGAVCLSVMATPAAASQSATIRVDDVDPESQAGAKRLLRRVERASRAVCGEDIARRYPSTRRAYRYCVERTMVSTIQTIGSERLYSEFVTRYGHP